MDKRRYFYAFSNISPIDLERNLNESAAEGMLVRPFKNDGLFYFDFYDTTKEKCRYVVDGKPASAYSYEKKLKEEGWELVGIIFECYIWKKTYNDDIPKDFSNKAALYEHSKKMSIIFLIAAILFLIALIAFVWGIVYEKKNGVDTHFNIYLFYAMLQIPFLAYSIYAICKLFVAKNYYV